MVNSSSYDLELNFLIGSGTEEISSDKAIEGGLCNLFSGGNLQFCK